MTRKLTDKNESAFKSIMLCKCPRCRKGDMFVSKNPWNVNKILAMYEKCSVCGQPFKLEVGFYYDYGYTDYLISFVLTLISFIGFWIIVGFPFYRQHFFYWLFGNLMFLLYLEPWLIRVSRTIWLGIFVKYDPEWSESTIANPERMTSSRENGW